MVYEPSLGVVLRHRQKKSPVMYSEAPRRFVVLLCRVMFGGPTSCIPFRTRVLIL